MKLKGVRKILEGNDRGAQLVLDTVAAHVERAFGVRWTSIPELLDGARVLIAQEKYAGLAKRQGLRGDLAKVAARLGVAGTIEEDTIAAEDDAPLAQHVAAGSLRKNGGGKMPKDPARQAAKVAAQRKAAADGVEWTGLRKKQRNARIELELANAGDQAAVQRLRDREERGLEKRIREEQEVELLQKQARDTSDPISAARAREQLDKLAATAVRAPLRAPASSGTILEDFGQLGYRPRR